MMTGKLCAVPLFADDGKFLLKLLRRGGASEGKNAMRHLKNSLAVGIVLCLSGCWADCGTSRRGDISDYCLGLAHDCAVEEYLLEQSGDNLTESLPACKTYAKDKQCQAGKK